jgi:hypothetical protein
LDGFQVHVAVIGPEPLVGTFLHPGMFLPWILKSTFPIALTVATIEVLLRKTAVAEAGLSLKEIEVLLVEVDSLRTLVVNVATSFPATSCNA